MMGVLFVATVGLLALASTTPVVGDGATAGDLRDAIVARDVDRARALLDAGADPELPRANGFTPLMQAAIRDDAPMVELLISAGADLAAVDPEGLAAIHVAAERDAVGALQVLIDAGADPSARSSAGMDLLDHAAASGSVEVLAFAAGIGLDLDAPSLVVSQGHGYPRVIGATPLGIAVRAGQLDAVRALLDLGADVDGLSSSEHSPLLVAVFSGQAPELVATLLDAGADRSLSAGCDQGCSGPGGDALAWALELNRDDLVPLLRD